MESEVSLLHSQETASGLYPEPDESSQCPVPKHPLNVPPWVWQTKFHTYGHVLFVNIDWRLIVVWWTQLRYFICGYWNLLKIHTLQLRTRC